MLCLYHLFFFNLAWGIPALGPMTKWTVNIPLNEILGSMLPLVEFLQDLFHVLVEFTIVAFGIGDLLNQGGKVRSCPLACRSWSELGYFDYGAQLLSSKLDT